MFTAFPEAGEMPSMRLRSLLWAALAVLSAAAVAEDGREHFVPLFMSAADPDGRQGFVRIVNHSDRSGTVRI